MAADYTAYRQGINPAFYHDPAGFVARLRAAAPSIPANALKPLDDTSVGFLVPTGKSRIDAWLTTLDAGAPIAQLMDEQGRIFDDSRIHNATRKTSPRLFALYRQSESELSQLETSQAVRRGDLRAIAGLALSSVSIGPSGQDGAAGAASPGIAGSRPTGEMPRSEDTSLQARPPDASLPALLSQTSGRTAAPETEITAEARAKGSPSSAADGAGSAPDSAAKLSFDSSLNVVDKNFSINAKKIIADNPIAVKSYAGLQNQGIDIVLSVMLI